MFPKRYIPPFRKIISHKINWILSKAGSVHKRWLSLGEHGSLLDCRQQTVRFLENPEIWFLLPSGTSRLIQCQTLWSTSSSGSSQRLLEASTEVRLKSCNSPKILCFSLVLESMGISRYHERRLHWWDNLPLRDPWPVAVRVRQAMVSKGLTNP